jgi:hypothetical protein
LQRRGTDAVDSFHRAEALGYVVEGDHSSADITGVTGLFTMDPREVQA